MLQKRVKAPIERTDFDEFDDSKDHADMRELKLNTPGLKFLKCKESMHSDK